MSLWDRVPAGSMISRTEPPAFHRRDWPGLFDLSLALLLAALFTFLNLYLGSFFGRDDFFPYDGVAYLRRAHDLYYSIVDYSLSVRELARLAFASLSGLWVLLIAVGYLLFGAGDWQTLLVFFWPTALLLVLVSWAVRRLAGRWAAVLVAVLTGLLPVFSYSFNVLFADFLGERTALNTAYGLFWGFTNDIKADLLAAVLMVWSIALIAFHGREANRWTMLASGLAVSLAVLTKGPNASLYLLAWGVGLLTVLLYHRREAVRLILTAYWAAVPLAVLLGPWLAFGGLSQSLDYIVEAVSWRERHLPVAGSAAYYLDIFIFHVGLQGLAFLGLAAVGLVLGLRRLRPLWSGPTLPVLLAAAAVALVIPSLNPLTKSTYQGLPFHLSAWLAATCICAALIAEARRRRAVLGGLSFVLALGIAVMGADVATAARELLVRDVPVIQNDREMIREITEDIWSSGAIVTLLPVYGKGMPDIILHRIGELVRKEGGRAPMIYPLDSVDGGALERDEAFRRRFQNNVADTVDAILIFEEDPSVYYFVDALRHPHYRAVQELLERDDHPFCLVRTYAFGRGYDGKYAMPNPFLYFIGSSLKLYLRRHGADPCPPPLNRGTP